MIGQARRKAFNTPLARRGGRPVEASIARPRKKVGGRSVYGTVSLARSSYRDRLLLRNLYGGLTSNCTATPRAASSFIGCCANWITGRSPKRTNSQSQKDFVLPNHSNPSSFPPLFAATMLARNSTDFFSNPDQTRKRFLIREFMAGFVEVERRTRSRSFFLSFFFFFTFEIFRSKREKEREKEEWIDRNSTRGREGGEDRGGATKYNCLVRGSIEEARARPTR